MGEIIFTITLLALFSTMFIDGTSIPIRIGHHFARDWPQALLVLLLLLLFINLIRSLWAFAKEKSDLSFLQSIKNHKKFMTGFALIAIYVLSLDYGGFLVTSIIFCICYSKLLGENRISKLFINSSAIVCVMYSLFVYVFGVILPRGVGVFRTFHLMIESLF